MKATRIQRESNKVNIFQCKAALGFLLVVCWFCGFVFPPLVTPFFTRLAVYVISKSCNTQNQLAYPNSSSLL